MEQDFAGRTALITGGTRGIGLGIAAELVARGANVVVTARKPDELDAAVAELDPDGTGRAMAVRGSADDEAHQAEALNFIKWFEQADTQRMWAAAGGVPARTDALQSSEFLNAAPWNKVYADSVPYLRDFWNVPEYAQLLDIQTSNVNAALAGEVDSSVDVERVVTLSLRKTRADLQAPAQ